MADASLPSAVQKHTVKRKVQPQQAKPSSLSAVAETKAVTDTSIIDFFASTIPKRKVKHKVQPQQAMQWYQKLLLKPAHQLLYQSVQLSAQGTASTGHAQFLICSDRTDS